MVAAALSIAQGLPDPPKVEVTTSSSKVKAGEWVDAEMTVTFGEHLHGYQNPPSDPSLIPIAVQGTDGAEVKDVQYPKGEVKTLAGIEAAVVEGTIKIPFKFRALQGGSEGVPIGFRFQQCDDTTCYIPETVQAFIKVEVEGTAQPEAAGGTEPPAPTTGTASGTSPPAQKSDNALLNFLNDAYQNKQWLPLIGALLLIGLAINLTPCVYPMVPITLSFFSSQSKENSGNRFALGFMYMLGIAITYGFIGGLAAASGQAFGTLFTNPWFSLVIGVFMLALALSMFDVYQIGLPPFISKQLKGRSGPVGSLIMGMLLGFGAAPCAGPLIVGVFLLAAGTGNAFFSVIMFVLVGLGLGVPYMILAAVTKSGSGALPKAGTWMKAVKAVLGLVVIYFGLTYVFQGIPVIAQRELTNTLLAWFFALSAVFMIWYESKSSDSRTWIIKSAAAAICGFLVAQNLVKSPEVGAEFTPYTAEAYDAAVTSGKPIFVDFGANWCTECKEIEHNVFSKAEAAEKLDSFVRFKVDWSTGVDPAYQEETKKRFNVVGLPHLVVVKPGGEIAGTTNQLKSVADLEQFLKKAQ